MNNCTEIKLVFYLLTKASYICTNILMFCYKELSKAQPRQLSVNLRVWTSQCLEVRWLETLVFPVCTCNVLRLHGTRFFQKRLLVLKREDGLGAHAALRIVPGSVGGVALICEVDEVLKVVSFSGQTIFMCHGLDSVYSWEASR